MGASVLTLRFTTSDHGVAYQVQVQVLEYLSCGTVWHTICRMPVCWYQSKCTAWSGLHTNSGKSGFGSVGLQIVDFLNLWAYLAPVHFALTPDNSDRSWIKTCGITFEQNGNNTPAVIIVFIDQDGTTNFQQERWRVSSPNVENTKVPRSWLAHMVDSIVQ